MGGFTLRVEDIVTSDGKKRYLLVDDNSEPVEPVYKLLRFKDNAGKQRNTLRAYCYHLKEFLNYFNKRAVIIVI